jgi:SAM-dependent methyltransferase
MKLLGSSFRDPAGYVFEQDGRLKRMVTEHGREEYGKLVSSGLYARLSEQELMIPHVEEAHSPSWPEGAQVVLLPEIIPFISYPYEWSFGQLKDAALLTLQIQELALEHGMSLKDASAFNVQFRGPNPVLIDTLSFQFNDGGPWPAYAQFCRHFLGPLLLMRHVWSYAGSMLRVALDGFPLDFVSAALPWRTYLDFGALVHVHLHARSQRKNPQALIPQRAARDPKAPINESLRSMIEGLEPTRRKSEWANYYAEADHYSAEAESAKRTSVIEALDRLRPSLVYDLGGNTGAYSRLATQRGAYCISFDLDPACVHLNYTQARREGDKNMLPLVMDLSNPSPDLGFACRERMGLDTRPKADLLLALALVHHLRITANVPFARIAAYFATLGRALLIEWVPKPDPKVTALLRSRPDTFHDYREEAFAAAFRAHFRIQQITKLPGSERALYLLGSGRS